MMAAMHLETYEAGEPLCRGYCRWLPHYTLLAPPDIWYFKRCPPLSGSHERRQEWPPLSLTPPRAVLRALIICRGKSRK